MNKQIDLLIHFSLIFQITHTTHKCGERIARQCRNEPQRFALLNTKHGERFAHQYRDEHLPEWPCSSMHGWPGSSRSFEPLLRQNSEWVPFGCRFRSPWAPWGGSGVQFRWVPEDVQFLSVWGQLFGGKKKHESSDSKSFKTHNGRPKKKCCLTHG